MTSSPQPMQGYTKPQGGSPSPQNKGAADLWNGSSDWNQSPGIGPVANGQPQIYGAEPMPSIPGYGQPQPAPPAQAAPPITDVPQYSAPQGSPMAPTTVNLPQNGQGGAVGALGMPPGPAPGGIMQPGGAYQGPWSPGPRGMR
jgi:hypothetical protein